MSQVRECPQCGETYVPANGPCATCDPWRAIADDVWSELPAPETREQAVSMYARALQEEYERGKQHSADDLSLSQRHCRAQAEEIADLKRKVSRMKVEATAIANALGERGLLDFADDVRMLTKL